MRRRYAGWHLCALLILALLPICAGAAWAFIREGGVPGRPGLSFHRMAYYWDHLEVSITNSTKRNVIFGGAMVFLDRHKRPVARAELLPEKIRRSSTRRYRGIFTEGSGEEASAAWSLVWELSQRNN